MVCVRRAARGRGLCSKLLRAAIERSEVAHRRRVRVYCHSKNSIACRCYQRVFGQPVHVTDWTAAFEVDLF
jgi:L-amino acid N-acyltransferase YncA